MADSKKIAEGISNSTPNSEKRIEVPTEFYVFVATVYGEAFGCGEEAWKAVGNVIFNRIGRYDWKKFKTMMGIIKSTGFDAYTSGHKELIKTIDVKNPKYKQLYSIAYSYLVNKSEKSDKTIDRMKEALKPIYDREEKDNTDDCVYFYSPKLQSIMHKRKPLTYRAKPEFLDNKGLIKHTIAGVNEDKFSFYYYNKKEPRQ